MSYSWGNGVRLSVLVLGGSSTKTARHACTNEPPSYSVRNLAFEFSRLTWKERRLVPLNHIVLLYRLARTRIQQYIHYGHVLDKKKIARCIPFGELPLDQNGPLGTKEHCKDPQRLYRRCTIFEDV